MQKYQQIVIGLVVCFALPWVGAGCRPSSPPTAEDASHTDVPQATSIPLRIGVVSRISNPDSLVRRWLSGSEQPIAVQDMSVEDFLEQTECEFDVLLTPSYLLGELLDRDWIVKLPTALQPTEAPDAGGQLDREWDADATQRTGEWPSTAAYAGVVYGLPLGNSSCVALGSDSLCSQVDRPAVTWDEVLDLVAQQPKADAQSPTEDAAVDPVAIVDRFLAIAFSLSERNSRYGLLFDIKGMRPRLSEPEFVLAAEIMQRLAAQPGGREALLGSHSQAWTWAATHPQAVVTVASPAWLTEDASQLETGGLIPIDGIPSTTLGHGLLVSLTKNCRQTQHSVEFLKWLRGNENRQFLAGIISGVDAPSQGSSPSVASSAKRELRDLASSERMIQEPRMPSAHRYRHALADQLLFFLRGEKSADQALHDASQDWLDILASMPGKDLERQRLEYQQSLGMVD